jgi:two-component system CheB/CheR fusion protein
MLPYRTARDVISGVVITLVDVDRVKRAELLGVSSAFAERIVETVREPLAVLDGDFCVVSANPAFKRRFGDSEGAPAPRSLFEWGAGAFASPGLRAALSALGAQGTSIQDYEVVYDVAEGGQRRLMLNACRLIGRPEITDHLLVTLADVGPSTTAPSG